MSYVWCYMSSNIPMCTRWPEETWTRPLQWTATRRPRHLAARSSYSASLIPTPMCSSGEYRLREYFLNTYLFVIKTRNVLCRKVIHSCSYFLHFQGIFTSKFQRQILSKTERIWMVVALLIWQRIAYLAT